MSAWGTAARSICKKRRARRAQGRTLVDIAETLGVVKSSVSLWVRDTDVETTRRMPTRRRPHPHHLAKLSEISECDALGVERLGTLGDDAFVAAGVALYAGEGAKRDGEVTSANTDPRMIRFFCA